MGGKCGGDGSSGDPDQAVEDKAKNKSTTLFSSRASGGGYSDIIEDIGVAYALVGVSLSVIVVVDIAGVLKGSNDSMENGRNRRVGCWRFGKSFSCQVPGIKATDKYIFSRVIQQ